MNFRFACLVLLLLSTLAVPAGVGAEELPSPPRIVAHRGLLLHAPENTLANFRACIELRLGFEFDVARTKDGRLVCIHDDTVDRTTNGRGRTADLTFDELRRLDAGAWFAPQFAGEKVPTLEEVLQLIAAHRRLDLLFAVDLKAEGVEEEVARRADELQALDRLLFIGRTIVDADVRRRIKSVSPRAQTAAVVNAPSEFDAAVALPHVDWIYFRYLPGESQIEALRRGGRRAFLAGPLVAGRQPENWRRARQLGFDGLLTDFPLDLRTQLRSDR